MSNWLHHYRPPSPTDWIGREDEGDLRFHQQVKCVDLREKRPEGGIAFLGFACDEGVIRNQGRPGAKEGPGALRKAIATLPYNSSQPLFDCGDVVCDESDLEESQESLGATVQELRISGALPVLFGGGHEMAWGHFQGLKEEHVSIVNIDAHFDMRNEARNTSGTPFLQIANTLKEKFDYTCLGIQRFGNAKSLFRTAEAHSVDLVYAEDFFLNKGDKIRASIDRVLQTGQPIYLTICLDVFAAPFAPGVSAPQPLGLLPHHILPHIERLAKSGRLIGLDIAELCPAYDIDKRTARLAAELVSVAIHSLKEVGGE